MSAYSDITRISEIVGLPVAAKSCAINGNGGAIVALGGGKLSYTNYTNWEGFTFGVDDLDSLLNALTKLGCSAHDLAEVCLRFNQSKVDPKT